MAWWEQDEIVEAAPDGAGQGAVAAPPVAGAMTGWEADEVLEPASTAPISAPAPDGMTTRERIEAAKAGNLKISPLREFEQKAIDQKAIKDIRDASRPAPSRTHAFFANAAQGATFGFADEIVARALSARYGVSYEQAMQVLKDDLANTRKEFPVTSTVSEIGGSLVPGLLTAGAGVAAPGARIGSRIASGVAAGAAQGGLYGAGTAEPDERLSGAASGALVGGVIGGAVPAVASGIGSAARHVKDWSAGQRMAQGVADDLGVSSQTARHLADAVGSDDAIANLTVRPASKVLGYPEQKLIRWMEINRWVFRQNGKGPLQAYIDKKNAGYLDHKLGRYTDQQTGEDKVSITLVITPKGMAKLAKLIPTEGGAA